MKLYRIISLETFIDILTNNRERYVRPATWDDTFEGYLFSKLYNKEERQKIVKELYYNVCPRNYKGTINNLLKFEHAKWFVYGQCWSRLADSDAMWRIYSYNNHSIQVQTTDRRIDMILNNVPDIKYDIKSVKYDVNPDANLIQTQVEQLKNTLSVYEPFLHKRKAFRHEAETRVLIDDIKWFQISEISMMGANWKIFETMNQLSDDEQILEEINNRLDRYVGKWKEESMSQNYYINIDELSKYITGVKVNPFAEDWYVDLIGGMCEKYKLKFNGKSNLYYKDENFDK